MANYSIKDLENFTKIKAHTLRIWEQRYQLLSPKRTETNIRYYSDKDLKKILNINLLYQNGLKISKIAQLSENEIFEKAQEILIKEDTSSQDVINKFVEYILELDDQSIQELLRQQYDKLGMETLFTSVLIPLLEKIGVLWQVDAISVSHEHFVSNLLREFIIVKIDGLPINRRTKGKVVLFLKEAEKHELSLLFYYYLLKSRGYDCFYLGQSVPMKDLKILVQEIQPDFLVSSLIAELTKEDFKEFFTDIESFFDISKLFVGGIQLLQFKDQIPDQVHTIQSIDDIKLM